MLWSLLGAVVLGTGVVMGGWTLRTSEHPGTVPFALLSVLLGGLAGVGAAVQSDLFPVEFTTAFELLFIGGYGFASLLWISFVFEYTGRGPSVTVGRGLGLALLGGLTVLSTAVTWLQQTGQVQFGVVGQLSYVSTFVFQMAVFSLGLLGAVLVARSTVTYDDLSVGPGVALVTGGIGITVLPLTVGYVQQISRPTTLRITVLQLGLVIALFGLVQFVFSPFARAPSAGHLARETVLDAMTAPVLVADRGGRVLDVNQAAAKTFGLDTTSLRDHTVAALTGVTAKPLESGPVVLQTTTGQREFVVEQNTITDSAGSELGQAYRFRDITDRETREQRLQVLNRVTRHNLRNDLDAIRGFAEPMRNGDTAGDEASAHFDRIETVASGLVELAETIERSERVMSKSRLEQTACNLTAIAREVATDADCRQITVSSESGPVTIQSNRGAITLILQELVDNAVTHNDRAAPTVEISVQQTAFGGRVAVEDDGPGIPDDEQAVVADGVETRIKHGTGVGLWLVYWAITRLGGELKFESAEPRGSVVIVRLPDLASANESNS